MIKHKKCVYITSDRSAHVESMEEEQCSCESSDQQSMESVRDLTKNRD